MIIRIEDGVSTSINVNFDAWYEVEITLSDDPRQKETIDGIIWLKRKKVCNLQIRHYFWIAHVAQLMVSKMKFFCQRVIRRYPYRAIQRGIPNFNTSGSWKMTMADWFYVTLGLDVWRNCSLCLRKRVKFQTWGTKMFLRKFYQI